MTVILLNLIAFALLLAVLVRLHKQQKSLSTRVFTGLGLGVAFGATLQALYGADAAITRDTINYINIVGSGYVSY